MRRFVLDSGVALAWFIDRGPKANAYASRVLELLEVPGSVAVVPGLWHVEVGAVLIRTHRNPVAEFDADALDGALAIIDSIKVETHHVGIEPRQVVQLASAYNLSGYDAGYFQLALSEGLPIAALDGGLKQACEAFGVELLKP